MSYFAPFIDETGIHIPTYADRMAYMETGYKQIFGSDVYYEADSQDYQLISLFCKALDDLSAVLVDVYNSRNPNWATAVSLDGHLPFAGIRRYAATFSTAMLTLTGQAGASLPEGQLVRDESGHSWRTTSDITFDELGQATVKAVCAESGAIVASAGTINIIETPTSAWESVTNPEDAIPGRNTETDAAVRVRRAKSVGLPGRCTLEGIRSALINISGVEHVSVLENTTGEVDENGIAPHAVCALVAGGDDMAIAEQIYMKKSPGGPTYGNTSIVYQDTYGKNNIINFSRPVRVTASITVRVRPLFGWDGDYMVSAIRQNLISYINGIGIGEPLVVSALWGESFKASTTTPAFSILGISAEVNASEDYDAVPATSDTLPAAYDTKYITDEGHITISVEEGS